MSPLSGSNIQLFGLGLDFTPGKFRVTVSAGRIGRSVMTDTATQIQGEYAREAYMGKFAFVDSLNEIGLNVVRVRDDDGSIPTLRTHRIIQPDPEDPSIVDTIALRDPLMPIPEESFTTTLNALISLTDEARITAEVGGSLFTRDMTSEQIAEPISEIEPLIEQRLSTQADFAGKVEFQIDKEKWGLSLNSTYIGPGYRTLAYPWMEADRFDITAAPRLQLLNDRLAISGSIGWRQNNLGKIEEATTSQLLGSANVDVRIGEDFTINGQYSNYGLRTPVKNDTFRVETVAQSISLTPMITIASEASSHVIMASVSVDDYADYNIITGASESNRTHSVMGTYSTMLTSIPLSTHLAGSWLTNHLEVGDLTIASASIGAGYELFNSAVKLGVSGSMTQTGLDVHTPDRELTLGINGRWRITNGLLLLAKASVTNYRYGDSRPNTSFQEIFVRTSLQWQW